MLYQAVYARSAIILTIICAASLLPLLVLYLEFRGIPFCNEAYWFYIAKLYGSYFLFPIFGTIAAIFLLVPFAVLMLVLQVENFRPILRYAAVALIGLVIIASLIEFTGSPHAVFEVSPQALRSGDGQKFFNKLKTACTSDFAYKGKYDGVEGSYQYDLGDAKSSGLSYSHFVYYVAIPAQVALLVSLLVGFCLIIYFRKNFFDGFLADRKLNWERNNFFLLFGIALIIGSIWCLYRISYRVDNIRLFGSENNTLYADYSVFWLYFAVVAIYIIFAGFDLERLAKTGSQLASAAGIVGLSLTAPSGLTGYFFGLNANLQNLAAVLVLLGILIGVGLLFNSEPPKPPLAEPEDG